MAVLTFDYDRYQVKPDEPFRLADRDTSDAQGLSDADKDVAKEQLKANRDRLRDWQEQLYAENKQSLLVVLQAMDTGGKDSTIRSVTKGINPQGVRVPSFKKPTDLEMRHDFLWRVHQRVPPAGMITIFNRSHYEEVLVVRVHGLAPPARLEKRYDHINNFERLLTDSGTRIIKIMLHISKDYQLERLRRRLRHPEKYWKFNPGDLAERKLWDGYMESYEVALQRCSTDYAPWYVIPAEKRWFRNLVISQLLVDTLEDMNPQFPPPSFDPKDYPPESLE